MDWASLNSAMSRPLEDPIAIASVNATIATILLGVLGFIVASYYARREELKGHVQELATGGIGAVLIPAQSVPDEAWDAVGQEVRRAEHEGRHVLLRELEQLVTKEVPSGERARAGRRLIVLSIALAYTYPMPARYHHFGEDGERLLFIGGRDERPEDVPLWRFFQIGDHCFRVRKLLLENTTTVTRLLRAADASVKDGPYTESIEAFLNYFLKVHSVARQVVDANSRLHRFDEGRVEPRLITWATPFLLLAFLSGVTVPLLFPAAPMWGTVLLPQLIFVVGLATTGILAFQHKRHPLPAPKFDEPPLIPRTGQQAD